MKPFSHFHIYVTFFMLPCYLSMLTACYVRDVCLFLLTKKKKLCVWINSLLNIPFSLLGPYTCLVFYILIVNLAFNSGAISPALLSSFMNLTFILCICYLKVTFLSWL